MNNDIGPSSAQGEGTTLPPPRLLGEMTTLTFAAGSGPAAPVGTIAAMAALPASGSGTHSPLRAAILHVEPDALTITF